MIRSHNLGCRTLYEVIGVKEDASQEEIRRSYRSSILTFHPDKLPDTPNTSETEHSLETRFLEVQKAWKVLNDPGSRALYDHELRTSRQEAIGADDVSLGDMMVVEEGEGGFELSYQCRCGDIFSIGSCELDEMGYRFSRDSGEISLESPSSSLPVSIVLPCGSCSLKIRLVIEANVS